MKYNKKFKVYASKKGMQRIKTIRWPVRNPNGDRLFYKAKFVTGGVLVIPNATSFSRQTIQLNNMAAIGTLMGDSPGLNDMSTKFRHYRVRGIKISQTYWPDAGTVPLVAYHNAQSGADYVPTPSISTTTELRWAKYRVISSAATGARPTRVSAYYSVNKVFGPDMIVKNDQDFTGDVGVGSPSSWTAPVSGPFLETGIFTMSGLNATAQQNITFKREVTVYLQFYGKAQDTN